MDPRRARALIAITLVSPPDGDFRQLLATLLLLISQQPPTPITNIRNRLFGSLENHWMGRDVFSKFAEHPYEFFEITGETPELLLDILTNITPELQRENRPHILSPRNRVMLFMIWLRSYPSLSVLSLLFEISVATVGNELNKMRCIMWNIYANQIVWPSQQEWQSMRGHWSKLPDAVGAIDGTSHRIYRPGIEPQALYFSGHRHTHCVHTMVIIDNHGILRYVRSGFPGHQNDAQVLTHLPDIGPNMELEFPNNCVLLADKIFPNVYPFTTPYRHQQILQRNQHQQRKCRKFNRILSSYRVKVEHAIRGMKIYRVIGMLWRHPRWYISSVVDICAALAVRRQTLFQ